MAENKGKKKDPKEWRLEIDAERCKGCGFCVEFCPKNTLAMSDEFNSKGYHPPMVADPESCTYCDMCEMVCPEFAIYAVSEKNKKDAHISDELLRMDRMPHIWCPGCGHGIVLGSLLRAVEELELDPTEIVMTSGIGCSARISGYVNFHSLHNVFWPTWNGTWRRTNR